MAKKLIQRYPRQNLKEITFLPDQDIISALYGDKVKIIDTMKYNYRGTKPILEF